MGANLDFSTASEWTITLTGVFGTGSDVLPTFGTKIQIGKKEFRPSTVGATSLTYVAERPRVLYSHLVESDVHIDHSF